MMTFTLRQEDWSLILSYWLGATGRGVVGEHRHRMLNLPGIATCGSSFWLRASFSTSVPLCILAVNTQLEAVNWPGKWTLGVHQQDQLQVIFLFVFFSLFS